MSETKVVVGTLAGIMEKTGDWRELHISVPGKQYPVKVSTKKEELVQLARAAGESVMEWTYTEQDSGNPNPHKPGTNYVNRYFEGVAPVGSGVPVGATYSVATPASAPQAGGSEGMSKEEWARKDRAADLRACIAIAAGALQHTVKSEPSNDDLNEFTRRTLFVARQFHNVVTTERGGEDVPFLSEHDDAIPY